MGFIADSLGLIGNIFYRASNMADGVTGMLKVDARPWESLYGKATGRDYDKLVRRYTSWVYACATKNAKSCAQVPLRLYGKKTGSRTKFIVPTKTVSKEHKDWLFKQPQLHTKLSNAVDVEEIMEHPFLDLLANVNPYMNGIDLMELWVLYQELTGNAYTYVVKNNIGTPEQLWIVPPMRMKIIPDLEMFIKAYVYGTDPSKRITFEPDEIIHMKYPNPHSLYYGYGPLAAAALAVDAGAAMSSYEYNLLMNDAIPRSALVTDRILQQGQVDKLKNEWNTHYRGVNKAGKLAILAGGLRVDKISMSPKEMGHLLGRKYTREEVAAVFEVPMSKLSVEDIRKAPVGGMQQGNVQYQKDTILPKLRKIEAKLNEKLLPMYDDKLFCAFDNPVGEDREYRLKERDMNIKNGYSSINQERLRDNQEAVEWGEVPWLASGLVQTDADRSLSPSLDGGGSGANSGPPASDDGKEAKYIDPDDLPSERKTLARLVKRMFRLQAQEVLGNMPRSSRSVVKSVEEFWLPEERRWVGWLAEESTPEMVKLTKKGAAAGAKKLAVSVGVQVNAPEMAEFAKRHAYKFSFSVNSETMDILRTNMAEGLQTGENMYQIRKRVQSTFDDMSKYRAERIARTESARAVNAGMENGWQQSGVVEAKEWDGASDMCEFCQSMNAKYGPGTGGIPLGSAFVGQGEGVEGADGGNLGTSYGAIEYPPIHPNCRCDLLPVVKDAPADKPIEQEIPPATDEYAVPNTVDARIRSEVDRLVLETEMNKLQAAKAAMATNQYSNKFFQVCRDVHRGEKIDDAAKAIVEKMNDKLGLVGKQRMSVRQAVYAVDDYVAAQSKLESYAVGRTGIHRGIGGEASKKLNTVGKDGSFILRGPSSFSESAAKAAEFASSKGENPIVITIKSGKELKKATNLDYISDFVDEREVLVGNTTKLKVLRRYDDVIDDGFGGGVSVTRLICEEMQLWQ